MTPTASLPMTQASELHIAEPKRGPLCPNLRVELPRVFPSVGCGAAGTATAGTQSCTAY